MKSYFSSDYHLGHANIIKYDKRPFSSVEEMNKVIIDNHNAIVKPEDDFYFLGDFCMGDHSRAESYLKVLNGKKFFIKGNHDKRQTVDLYKQYGTYLGQLADVKIGNQHIILCHYAMKVWDKSHHGAYHLYGHSHGTLPEDPHSLSFDIGVNNWDYKPVSFETVREKMSKKVYKPIDHHASSTN